MTASPRSECVLELDQQRQVVSGSEEKLAAAIRRGADLRIHTDFHWNDHVQPGSANPELVEEVGIFQTTYLVEGHWVAGIVTLRQPHNPMLGFGPRPSMSFFMYNQNGQQAVARPYLDGEPTTGKLGPSPVRPDPQAPKYEPLDSWDAGTNAPSVNFVWNFEKFRFLVRDDWQEVYACGADGAVTSGSLADLRAAFIDGAAVKVGIRGLCRDLAADSAAALEHEVFFEVGVSFYQRDSKVLSGGTYPFIRVRPGVPMKYTSGGWDFGWGFVRTDGYVERWLVDPYTLKFEKSSDRCAMRWFVR